MPSLRGAMLCLLTCSFFGCNTGTRYPRFDPAANVGLPPNASRDDVLERERQQAVRFDPYPDNDIGPKIDGGRPIGYGQQLPEAVRGRWVRQGP